MVKSKIFPYALRKTCIWRGPIIPPIQILVVIFYFRYQTPPPNPIDQDTRIALLTHTNKI